MNHHPIAFTRLLGAAAVLTLVAACGSGGGGSGDSGPVVPSTVFRITCTVVEQVGGSKVAVAGADVVFSGKSGNLPATTDSNGKCTLDVPAADAQTAGGSALTWTAASVTKAGYEPNTIICPRATTGTACDQEVLLVRVTTNTSLPEFGDVVMHVGNGAFGGEINSRFQKDPDGPSFDFTIADWESKLALNSTWTRATVVLDAKGWQTPLCANTIAIVGAGGSQVRPGGDSPVDGNWGVESFNFDVAAIGRTGATALRITSGVCTGTTDIDDVETNRIRVYYCNATGDTACGPTP